MKTVRITLILAALLINTISYAQNNLYNKYSSSPHVSATYISKAMLEMQPNVNTMSEIYLGKISGQMEGVYILQTSESGTRANLLNDINKYIKQEKYELLMEQKKAPGNTSAYYIKRKNKEEVKELVMTTDRNNRLKFVLLVGNMTVKDIQQIIMFGSAQIQSIQPGYLADGLHLDISALKDFKDFKFNEFNFKEFNFNDLNLSDMKHKFDSLKVFSKKHAKEYTDSLFRANPNIYRLE